MADFTESFVWKCIETAERDYEREHEEITARFAARPWLMQECYEMKLALDKRFCERTAQLKRMMQAAALAPCAGRPAIPLEAGK